MEVKTFEFFLSEERSDDLDTEYPVNYTNNTSFSTEDRSDELHHCFTNLIDEFPVNYYMDKTFDPQHLSMGRFKYHIILDYDLKGYYTQNLYQELISSIDRARDDKFTFCGISLEMIPDDIPDPLLCDESTNKNPRISYLSYNDIIKKINPKNKVSLLLTHIYIYFD